MAIKIALAGNPNCGKTTLFNDLTGSNQYVGNWPGVTVEKKEGRLKGHNDVVIQDLPGIYSLSPYTLEEVVARGYLVGEKPDAILNIIDGTNIERNLYLTTQLIELGIPVVMAVNMIDLVRKNGDQIDLKRLSRELGCRAIEISALKGEGSRQAAELAVQAAAEGKAGELPHVFTGSVEHAIAHIEESIQGKVEPRFLRWYAVKLFERDDKVQKELNLDAGALQHIDEHIADCEKEMDDDAESIITNQRYAYINTVVSRAVKKKARTEHLTMSDKIDRIVTNRILALPIFAVVMALIYTIAMGSTGFSFGTMATDWTNDVLFGEIVPPAVEGFLVSIGCADWLIGLINDGIVAGVGAVLGFVPQMLVLFLMLSILEDIGYMARVAFIMDRIFRKFGLSGKSFIPMLIGSGCGVPGVMASRTIEQDRDRKMTIMTTTFIPCGAKMPIVGLIAGALFGNSGWVSTGAYFIGVAAVIVSGIMLKKTKMFAGDPAPFVMELPAYHAPVAGNVLRSMWERGWSFIKRAGTVILVSSIFIWFTSSYGWAPAPVEPAAAETAVSETEVTQETLNEAAEAAIAEAEGPVVFGAVENSDQSILGKIGGAVAPVFEPLGFGNWQSTVATVMGLVAKEEVVGVFGVLYGVTDEEGEDAAMGIVEDEGMSNEEKSAALSPIAQSFDESSGGHGQLAAFAFLIFNLLCAPCFAAMGAIKREMNNGKWTAFAIGYQCLFAYAVALTVYQLGLLFAGAGFGVGTAVAILLVAFFLYMLLRKNRYDDNRLTQKVKVGA